MKWYYSRLSDFLLLFAEELELSLLLFGYVHFTVEDCVHTALNRAMSMMSIGFILRFLFRRHIEKYIEERGFQYCDFLVSDLRARAAEYELRCSRKKGYIFP